MGKLLKLANIKLEEVAESGAIVQVSVLWNCFLLFSKCVPDLQVTRLGSSGFSLSQTHHYVAKDGTGRRDVKKMKSLRFIWRSVGSGNQIDLISIIFYLAVAVALLPLADSLTDFVMVVILPERKHFSKHIYQETPDYSMLDERNAQREQEEFRRKMAESAVDVDALFAGVGGGEFEDDGAV